MNHYLNPSPCVHMVDDEAPVRRSNSPEGRSRDSDQGERTPPEQTDQKQSSNYSETTCQHCPPTPFPPTAVRSLDLWSK